MKRCPLCNGLTEVVDTRGDAIVKRRRRCLACGERTTTVEIALMCLRAMKGKARTRILEELDAMEAAEAARFVQVRARARGRPA